MIYMYDILLNWTKDGRLKEFFEWKLEDDLEHIKRIPIIKINSLFLKDILYSKIKVEKDFLNKIRLKTESYFHNEIDKVDYATIFTTDKKALAVEFDSNGNILYKSSLLLDEEEEVIEISKDLSITDIKYEVLEKNEKYLYMTRKEIEESKYLKKEIEKIKKKREVSKLNYLYKEFFTTGVKSFDDEIKIIEQELAKDYNDFHHQLYKLLKFTHLNKYP